MSDKDSTSKISSPVVTTRQLCQSDLEQAIRIANLNGSAFSIFTEEHTQYPKSWAETAKEISLLHHMLNRNSGFDFARITHCINLNSTLFNDLVQTYTIVPNKEIAEYYIPTLSAKMLCNLVNNFETYNTLARIEFNKRHQALLKSDNIEHQLKSTKLPNAPWNEKAPWFYQILSALKQVANPIAIRKISDDELLQLSEEYPLIIGDRTHTTINEISEERYISCLNKLQKDWLSIPRFTKYLNNIFSKDTRKAETTRQKLYWLMHILHFSIKYQELETVETTSSLISPILNKPPEQYFPLECLIGLIGIGKTELPPTSRSFIDMIENFLEIKSLGNGIPNKADPTKDQTARAYSIANSKIQHSLAYLAIHTKNRETANTLTDHILNIFEELDNNTLHWERVAQIMDRVTLDCRDEKIKGPLISHVKKLLDHYKSTVLSGAAAKKTVQDITEILDSKKYESFLDKHKEHIERITAVFSKGILVYGQRSKEKSPSKRGLENVALLIREHQEQLDTPTRIQHPVESGMELYSYIGLNEAIFQWTIESGQLSRDQQEFLVECLEKSSRFSIPLKITRRREKGKHAGQITGYYNITAYIPLPEHEITDEPYKKMTCFVKLMNDKNAHEREGFHHAKYHNLGNPSPKLLYTHAFKDTQIFIYQFADDKKIMELFGPEIESYIGKQK